MTDVMSNFKLAELAHSFTGYKKQMDMEIKARKDAEDMEITSIRDNIARLEKTLNSEVQRRTDANKALQGMFEAQMATVQDKLEAGLVDRLDALDDAVKSLESRIDIVDDDFSQARERYIQDIEDKSAMVSKDVTALQLAFQNERADRKDRETLIVAKLRDLEARTQEKFVKDEGVLEQQHSDLVQSLSEALHEDNDKRFHEHILEEMAALKTGLVLESQTRESADDNIVSALNHYTQAIQEALRVVNQA